MDITGIVLGVVISLLGIIITIYKFSADRQKQETERLVEQAKTNVHLSQIQKEILEIKVILCKNDEILRDHERRICDLERK